MTLTALATSRILDRTVPLVSIPNEASYTHPDGCDERAGTPTGFADETVETKEAAVSDEERARPLNGEAEAHQRAFEGLPAAGTPAYWRRIDDTRDPLPLEVLARCVRERHQAGQRGDADRVMSVVIKAIQAEVREFARRMVGSSRVAKYQDVASDLAQEIYLKVWADLIGEKDSYLLVQFKPALFWIEKHAAQKVMEQYGERKRQDVAKGKHIPVAETVRINRPKTDDEGHPIEMPLADPRGEDAYEQVETRMVVDDLLRNLSAEQLRLIYAAFSLGKTQDEIAADLGITDRTVRNRLKTLINQLRGRAGEEDSGGTR